MKYFFSTKSFHNLIKALIKPRHICKAVEDIDLGELYRKGYRTIFLDIDNTLLTYSENEISLQRVNWIEQVKMMGYHVFIVSNNSSYRRVKKISEQMGVFGIYFATKPFVFGIKELASDWGVDFKKSIVVGDQLLTDIAFGNWLRAYTVLIEPLDKNVSFLRTVQREIELYLLKKIS